MSRKEEFLDHLWVPRDSSDAPGRTETARTFIGNRNGDGTGTGTGTGMKKVLSGGPEQAIAFPEAGAGLPDSIPLN